MRARAWLGLCAVLFSASAGAQAPLRVGTSGDYPPFSRLVSEDPPTFEGFDVALAQAWATERGRAVEFVQFRWPDLLQALAEDRFDVAMSGVTVRPERSTAGRFSAPVLESGAVVLVRHPERFPDFEALDRRVVRIGVNAGGHLERAASARFRRATLVAIPDNTAVREALLEESVNGVVTDTLEAPEWLRDTEGIELRGPFTRDRKAYLVRNDRPELAADLDAWLLARERDGTLGALRQRFFGDGAGPALALPLPALLAAVDERLSLMPLVGVAKRDAGLPLEAPEREAYVVDSAVAALDEAARRAQIAPPPDAPVRALFRAFIAAAKEVQWENLQDPGYQRPESVPDLNEVLRPALLRIGVKISQLLLELPANLDADGVRAAAQDGLRTPHLSDAKRHAIADAIVAVAVAPRAKPSR